MRISGRVVFIGAVIALAFLIMSASSLYFSNAESNNKFHTVDITITGKICNEDAFGSRISKIQGSDGIVYWILNEDCNLYPVGSSGMMFYQHVESLSMFGGTFNRTIGDWK